MKLIYAFLLLACTRQAFAQTPTLQSSLLQDGRALYNPATTGVTHNAIYAVYRNQWRGYDKNYQHIAALAQFRLLDIGTTYDLAHHFGLGINLSNTRQSFISTTTAMLQPAFHLQLRPDLFLSIGGGIGFQSQSIDLKNALIRDIDDYRLLNIPNESTDWQWQTGVSLTDENKFGLDVAFNNKNSMNTPQRQIANISIGGFINILDTPWRTISSNCDLNLRTCFNFPVDEANRYNKEFFTNLEFKINFDEENKATSPYINVGVGYGTSLMKALDKSTNVDIWSIYLGGRLTNKVSLNLISSVYSQTFTHAVFPTFELKTGYNWSMSTK